MAVLIGQNLLKHGSTQMVRLSATSDLATLRVQDVSKTSEVEAVFSGDLMAWPKQCIYPDWNARFDADPGQTRRRRWAFLEANSDKGFIVTTSHFPLPSVGTISRRQSVFWFNDHQ